MKTINLYISEKLHINKNLKSEFDPDDLNNDDIKLYDCNYDDDTAWDDFNDWVERVNEKIAGFIKITDVTLSKLEDFEKVAYAASLPDLMKTIVTGKDAGYDAKLEHGHLVIDAVNSGSRRHFYIYGLSVEGADLTLQWANYDKEVEDLNFLFKEGYIVPIEDI